jgi:hypothetical protein
MAPHYSLLLVAVHIAHKFELVGLAITKSQEAVHLRSNGLVQIAESARLVAASAL